ncbi:MAG: hypothetical protein VX498_10395, partial [Myxococcota bacterium]|nr:hypothetical protein [Myxococcota bacterium]
IHAGMLAPLWVWVRILGLPPNLLPGLWTAGGLVASVGIGMRLLDAVPRDSRLPPPTRLVGLSPLLGGFCILAAAITWENALFVEVYAALAALLLGGLWALLAGRPLVAGLAIGAAATVHPGAWALVPGLLLLGEAHRLRAWLPPVLLATLIHGVTLALLFPDWWSGGRGLAVLPPFDQSPWESLQSLWRLLAGDLGLAAAPALVALPVLGGRRLLGLLLLVLGSAMVLCRYSDNPGGLPLLWVLASLTPLSVRWLDAIEDRRLRVATASMGLVLLLFGVADATSKQDAIARQAERRAVVRVETACPPPPTPSWAEAQLWALSCRTQGADTAPPDSAAPAPATRPRD